MATSGTYAFNLDIEEIIEESYEQIGIQYKRGEELRSARRSINLLLLDWINDNVPLWSVDQLTIPLTQDTQSYTLDPQWVDILDAVIRKDGTDVTATRLSMAEYLSRPTKATSGRPIQFTIERNASGHTLYVWPVASDDTYTFVCWGIRYLEDVGAYTNNLEIPKRFLPALCAGLAYSLAKKKLMENPEIIGPLLPLLKADYKDIYQKAKEEDEERADLFLLPALTPGRSR
jgi:hypothetical protein